MEKSIESIWKEGFLKGDNMIAPKVIDLYNQKTINTVERYKNTFRKNINAIVIGAIVFLPLSFLVKIPIAGIMMFFMFMLMALIDKFKLRELNNIDHGRSSYDYLIALDKWMKEKTKINIIIARVLYPYVLFAMVIGFWMINIDGKLLGAMLTEALLEFFPNTWIVMDVPMIGLIIWLGTTLFLVYFAERIYRSDLEIVYGQLLDKLNELILDIEELRGEDGMV